MKLFLLRGLLVVDAAVLFLLGGLLIFAPVQVEQAFHFQDLPPAVAYLIGMWSCLMATMGFGYLVASIPQPRQRFTSRIPTIDLWKEDEWEERYRAAATCAASLNCRVVETQIPSI